MLPPCRAAQRTSAGWSSSRPIHAGIQRSQGAISRKVDVDSAQREPIDAHVVFVGSQGRIDRRQDVGPRPRSAAARVLPCRQLPQYIGPAPAIKCSKRMEMRNERTTKEGLDRSRTRLMKKGKEGQPKAKKRAEGTLIITNNH